MVNIEYVPPSNLASGKISQGEAEKHFKEFVKKYEREVDRLKKEFPKATKAGIKDLLFFIWLVELVRGGNKKGFAKRVFSLARGLLGVLFVSNWIKGLSRFKLIGDKV